MFLMWLACNVSQLYGDIYLRVRIYSTSPHLLLNRNTSCSCITLQRLLGSVHRESRGAIKMDSLLAMLPSYLGSPFTLLILVPSGFVAVGTVFQIYGSRH